MTTYGRILSEGLLGILFHLHELQVDDDIRAILLKVPARNILNGILIMHAQEYRECAQKELISYLLSAMDDVDESSQNNRVNIMLETERLNLMELGESFEDIILKHDKLIARSQASLIQLAENLPDTDKIKQDISAYEQETKDINILVINAREKFHEALLSVRNKLKLVSDYISEPQDYSELPSHNSSALI